MSLWAGAYESRIHQPGQTEGSQFSIKILGVNFGNSILDNFNWDKISDGMTKTSVSGTEWNSLWEVKW